MKTSTHIHILELSLEPRKVADVPLNQLPLTVRSEVLPHFAYRGRSTITEGIGDYDLRGVVPPDPMGDGIGELEIVREGTSGDLEIVIWVAPSPEPALRGIVEDGRVAEVGARIYEAEQNISTAEDQRYRRRAS